ncbi:MAG: hypothetical protein IKQ91_09975 [Oscillospiraceae bacterium]|nr:hypothetical protein [Oscillospiraceae bacterium]
MIEKPENMGRTSFVFYSHSDLPTALSSQPAGGDPPQAFSPDVPSPGEFLHPETERDFLRQCFSERSPIPDGSFFAQ